MQPENSLAKNSKLQLISPGFRIVEGLGGESGGRERSRRNVAGDVETEQRLLRAAVERGAGQVGPEITDKDNIGVRQRAGQRSTRRISQNVCPFFISTRFHYSRSCLEESG